MKNVDIWNNPLFGQRKDCKLSVSDPSLDIILIWILHVGAWRGPGVSVELWVKKKLGIKWAVQATRHDALVSEHGREINFCSQWSREMPKIVK